MMQHIQPQICQHGFVVLFFLLSLPGNGADKGPAPGYNLSAQSVSVASGLCVEIPCTFSSYRTLSTSVTGIWRRSDISDIVAASTDASKVSERTKGRFTLTGKVHEGNCSFSISNAQPEDQGIYEFRFEDGDHKYSYQWNKLSVRVTNLPEPTIFPVGKRISGKQIKLTCTSHPAPQGCKGIITWEGRRNISNTCNYKENENNGTVTSTSDITFTPSQRDDKSSLTCTVTYSGVSTNSSITLDVEYAPRSPTISHCISAGCRVEVIEGTSLSLLCSAESNPPANLSWAKQNSIDPLNSSSGRLEVSHVTTDNEGDYMCQAMNEHGSSTASITVVIIFSRISLEICEFFCQGEKGKFQKKFRRFKNFAGNLQIVCQSEKEHICPSLAMTPALSHDKIIYHLKILMIRGISIIVLSGIISMSAVLVMRCRKKRRPPRQTEDNQRSSSINYQVVYSNTK